MYIVTKIYDNNTVDLYCLDTRKTSRITVNKLKELVTDIEIYGVTVYSDGVYIEDCAITEVETYNAADELASRKENVKVIEYKDRIYCLHKPEVEGITIPNVKRDFIIGYQGNNGWNYIGENGKIVFDVESAKRFEENSAYSVAGRLRNSGKSHNWIAFKLN